MICRTQAIINSHPTGISPTYLGESKPRSTVSAVPSVLPPNRSGRFTGDIIDDAGYAADLIDDPTGHALEKLIASSIANIAGSLYDSEGNQVGTGARILIEELPARAHVWLNRNQLSDLVGRTWNGTASLEIDNAHENLRLLNLNYINSATFFNFSCYETGKKIGELIICRQF